MTNIIKHANTIALVKLATDENLVDKSYAENLILGLLNKADSHAVKVKPGAEATGKSILKSLATGLSTMKDFQGVFRDAVAGLLLKSQADAESHALSDVPNNALFDKNDLDKRFQMNTDNLYSDADLLAGSSAKVWDKMVGVGRNAVRGGVGVLSDAMLNDHDGDYGIMDNLTSGIGGIGGGLLGSYIANKLGANTLGATVANLGGAGVGGWGLNKLRRSFT